LKLSVAIGVLFLLVSSRVFAQGEATEIEPVFVYAPSANQPGSGGISLKRIQRRLATDVGQLLVLFPGMQLKSYGGLGGMKTVSFRSLGAGHTSVVLDRFALSQTQSGQTDLGQLPVDFIRNLAVVHHAGTSTDYPIHAKLAGQIISIETRHLPEFYNDSFRLNVGAQAGSFGQLDGHFLVTQRLKSWRFSLSMKGRTFDGSYPFTYRNGNTDVHTRRTNGDLTDVFGTASISWIPTTKTMVHLSYSGALFDKGLPGAVVFYNETAGQRLYGNNHMFNLRHSYVSSSWTGATTAAFQQNSLDYVDSNYLNAQGYLHSHFSSQQTEAQTQWNFHKKHRFELLFGTGFRHETLISESISGSPKRLSIDGIAAIKYNVRSGAINLQVGAQSINDLRPADTRQTVVLLPSADYLVRFSRTIFLAAAYRYTVRQPSFNELYYNQVGNDDLRPEKAHMASLRMEHKASGKLLSSRATLQPFYVYTTDKILAIPTKNLFIWSIQNIGKSQAFGVELTERISHAFTKATLSLNVNYTFQYTQDLSDPEGPTYGHLLSYSPLHSGTAELSYEYQKWGLSALLTYQGERYALNENIPANLLEDFVLLDCSAFYLFEIGKRRQQLTVRAALNNITNNYYSYIRYFVMPGRNFTIRISYEL